MERSHSPDTTGTASSPDKKADTLPSEVDIPDLALVPDILERGDKAYLQAETVGPRMDERVTRPSHVLDG